MKAKDEKQKTPVRPYDDSMWDRNSMYDTIPYVWDPDLNVQKVFARETGNIIKAYRCKITGPYKLSHE